MKKMFLGLFLSMVFAFVLGGQEAKTKCPDNNKFCHKHGELSWSDMSDNVLTWKGATDYCKNMGGRLPTISELRALVQECPATGPGGSCKVTDDCLSYNDCRDFECIGCVLSTDGKYSALGDIGWLWSSSTPSEDSFGVWSLRFDYALVAYSRKNFDKRHARCVK